MTNKKHLGKIRWRCCRRGMLELDILLTGFFDQQYQDLPDKEKILFQELLEYPDQQLFIWLLGHEQPDHPEMALLIKKIREARKKHV